MVQPSKEELINSESTRLNVIMETLGEWSSLHEKMNDHYMGIIAKYQEERRELLKYLATIAGGAAALAPQLLDHVRQPGLFYLGIALLCMVVIVSVTYILSSIENDVTTLSDDLRVKNHMIYGIRKPKIDFLKKRDYSVQAFSGAMQDNSANLPTEDEKIELKNSNWYQPMDYTGEFIVLFIVGGLVLLVMGLTTFIIQWYNLILMFIVIFIIINIVSTFPNRVFVILGSPIDLTKSLFRLLKKYI